MKKELKKMLGITTRQELKAYKRYVREEKRRERKERKQPKELEPIIIEEIDILTNKVKSITVITQYEY